MKVRRENELIEADLPGEYHNIRIELNYRRMYSYKANTKESSRFRVPEEFLQRIGIQKSRIFGTYQYKLQLSLLLPAHNRRKNKQ